MLAADRQNKILELLKNKKSIRNIELTKILNVSIETVRRDLESLEQDNLICKVHGGAVYKEATIFPYSIRSSNFIHEKKELSLIAINYIKNGDIIALNSSSTNIELAKLIKYKELAITIITNSFLIAEELSSIPNIKLILAGGIYNKEEFAFLGQLTANFLSNFSVDKCFLSVGGVSLNRGITDSIFDEVLVEKKLIDISDNIIVMVDSSKIENNSLIHICNLEKIDTIITDSKLDISIKNKYIENSINLINNI